MPTYKKPRKPKTGEREIRVALTEKERLEFGRTLLGIKDGQRRQAALAEFARLLDRCASAVADAENMQLNSDSIALTRPLVLAARRCEVKLRAGDKDILTLMQHFKFVEFRTLFDQLDGIARFMEWLKSKSSQRGGERRSYVKHEKKSQARILENWFRRHHERSDPEAVPRAKKQFADKAVSVIERSLRDAKKASE